VGQFGTKWRNKGRRYSCSNAATVPPFSFTVSTCNLLVADLESYPFRAGLNGRDKHDSNSRNESKSLPGRLLK